jgi:hypothetical protein
MKGQLSYIIKPLSLVMTIVLLLLLYNSISTFGVSQKTAQKSLDLTSDATNILLVLANSEDCLAFHSLITQGLYANIIDVNKLNDFSQKYADTEPECARSFDFGWRVNIVEYKRVEGSLVTGKNWTFGAKDFSHDNALISRSDFSVPVAIRYSDKLTRSGVMQIHIVNGELEKISGLLDWACHLFENNRITRFSTSISTSYGLSYNPATNELCSVSKVPACRVMWCPLSFTKIKSGGDYILKMTYSGGTMVVNS